MPGLAQLGLQFVADGAEKVLTALDNYASKALSAAEASENMESRASSSFGMLGSAAQRASLGMAQFTKGMVDGMRAEMAATAAAKQAAQANVGLAGSINDVNVANATMNTGLGNATRAHTSAGNAANFNRMQTMELMHVTRAMIDGLAAGISPMRLFAMEGARVYQALSMGSGGVGGSLQALGGMLGKVVLVLGPLAAAFGAAFGGAALAVRDLNKEHKDLLDGMDLDEKQLEHLKDKGTNVHVTLGDVFKGTWNYLSELVDKNTKDAQSFMSRMLDDMTSGSVMALKAMVGAFASGFAVIKNTFVQLPAVVAEAVINATNTTIRGIQQMINIAIDGMNKLITMANGVEKTVLGDHAIQVGQIGHVQLGQVDNSAVAGAGGKLAADNKTIAAQAAKDAVAGVDRVLNGIGDAVIKAAQARIKDDAGKAAKEKNPPKGKADPRDMTDEFDAKLAQELAQAQAQELQAQLALTKDIKARAAIQLQVLDMEQKAQAAQIDKQEADIADNKGLSDAKKVQLTAELEVIKGIQAHTTELKKQNVNEVLNTQLAKNAIQLHEAANTNNVDLLKAQQSNSKSVLENFKFEVKIQQAQQEAETYKLEQTTVANGYTQQEVDIAQQRLKILPQIQAADQQHLKDSLKLADIFADVKNAFQGAADAFKSKDWGTGVSKLFDAIQTFISTMKAASTSAEKLQGIGGLLSGVGSMLGGSGGSILSGAGGGVSAAGSIGDALTKYGFGTLGSLVGGPIGGAVGGLLGGLFGGLFGGNKQKDQARRDAQNQAAQEAASKAEDIANQKRQIELDLVTATGDQVAILAATRADELSKIDASNKAAQQAVYDMQDRLTRSNQVHDIETQLLTISDDKVGLLNQQRQDENKTIDQTLLGLQGLMYAAQDANQAMSDAKDNLQKSYDATIAQQTQDVADATDALSSAYNSQSSSLTDLISKMTDAAKTIHDFRTSLDTDTSAMSPQNAYLSTKKQFEDISNRAQLGDQEAIAAFPDAGNAFKQASADYNGAFSQGYLNDINNIKVATDKTAAVADRTVSNAQAQLNALNKQVEQYLQLNQTTVSIDQGIKTLVTAQQALANTHSIVDPLLGINGSVMSLGAAIVQYQAAVNNNSAAITALANAVATAKANPANQPGTAPAPDSAGYTSTNGDYAAYVEGNPDLKAAYAKGTGYARGRTEAEFGVFHWATIGQYEGRPVRPYAQGGEFMVGGMGGTDSQNVNIMASPDEHVTVKTPSQMNAEGEAMLQQAKALEKIANKLDAVIYESQVDKTQLAAQTAELNKKLDDVVNAVDGVKRATRKAA